MTLKASLALPFALLLASSALAATDTWREPHSGIEFVRIKAGCFLMGTAAEAFSDQDPALRDRIAKSEQPQHEVCLDEFWISRHEITIGQWKAVMTAPPRQNRPDVPVAAVTWHEAVDFARLLERQGKNGQRFRLPTEAEWEFACRGGSRTPARMPTGEELNRLAWYSSPYDLGYSGKRYRELQPVGTKAPNAFGLNDMQGNVWEWTADTYVADAYRTHKLYNPRVEAAGAHKTIRGGSLHSSGLMVRCEARAWQESTSRHHTTGFRLVRSPIGAAK